jgi:hypothetical protein
MTVLATYLGIAQESPEQKLLTLLIELGAQCVDTHEGSLLVVDEAGNELVFAARRNLPLMDNGFPAELSSTLGLDLENFLSQFHLKFRPDHAISSSPLGRQTRWQQRGELRRPGRLGHLRPSRGRLPGPGLFEMKNIFRWFAGEAKG